VATDTRLQSRPSVVAPGRGWMAATAALALIGLGLATYLTIAHYVGKQALYCVDNSVINCGLVTTSKWSEILGVPVAVLGLVQYVVMAGLCSPWAWRSQRREVHLARFVFAVVGMAMVVWLVGAELLLIHAICLYCTGVHIVTFALFICIVRTVPSMLGWTER
jgi:uncharacterized membrane protein